ncbi:hypothetical protein DERP_008552 [Dermatophagoides pteronyssinus]|uniref:Uncharacterized protein n=1 Tax=Dermatophagoides pteronyssinus TaxID=6956 RepID=A0ABQ8IWM7_DERPT|nr:hypothetical protein DERP_008552 [Dermatophagoides pteronyssinus]
MIIIWRISIQKIFSLTTMRKRVETNLIQYMEKNNNKKKLFSLQTILLSGHDKYLKQLNI